MQDNLELRDEPATLKPPPPKTPAEVWAPIHGRYVVAHARPRNWLQVRYLMMTECQQMRFAEKARYEISRGSSSISGWSIDFATALVRAMQNMLVEVQRVSETIEERVVRVTVTDLETNTVFSQEASLDRFVLKRNAPRHLRGPVDPFRHNAQGQPLYRHDPSEQELSAATNAVVSKLTRNLVLRHAPTALLEDCMAELRRTVKAGQDNLAGQMPKRLLSAFGDLGVSPADLDHYLGHDLTKSNGSEFELLRSLFVALKNEDITWHDALESRLALRQVAHPLPKPKEDAPSPRPPPQSSPAASADGSLSGPPDGPGRASESTVAGENDLHRPRGRPPLGRQPAGNQELLRRLRQPKRGPVPT